MGCGFNRSMQQFVGIVLRLLEDDGDQTRTVLVEGQPKPLRMLAELLIAVADGNSGDGFYISPTGPG
jgi:hypothetical protein